MEKEVGEVEVEAPSEAVIAGRKIDLEQLKIEQEQLAKKLQFKKKDCVNINDLNTIAGCDCTFIPYQIIASIVVVDMNMEVIEEKFAVANAEFPYIPGFLAYRELPAMLKCYKKLESSPDVFMINGNGILHPRGLGLTSHFGLLIQKPTIGIASNLFFGEVKNSKVYVNGKVMAESLITKEGSKPIYISQGNMISLEDAVELVKHFLRKPHKLPEPLALAHLYGRKVQKEFGRKPV